MGMIRQLEDELREYDQLKSGELKLGHMERLIRATRGCLSAAADG